MNPCRLPRLNARSVPPAPPEHAVRAVIAVSGAPIWVRLPSAVGFVAGSLREEREKASENGASFTGFVGDTEGNGRYFPKRNIAELGKAELREVRDYGEREAGRYQSVQDFEIIAEDELIRSLFRADFTLEREDRGRHQRRAADGHAPGMF